MLHKQPITVEVYRGPVVESFHDVIVAVTNENGSLLHSWGNTTFLTYPRSAIKMLQAIPLVESGAADKFGLEERHIALACASHRGEKDHMAALSSWLEKIKQTEACLVCGGHFPANEAAAHEMIRRSIKPTALCNNCAGKHLGLVTTCLALGENPEGYEKYEHGAQKRLRQVLSEATHFDHAKTAHGVDGCGILTYAMPLQNIASGMSIFVNHKLTGKRREAVERIHQAVKTHPFYIAGSDDFATDVIEKTQGRVMLKGGAEGVFAGYLPEKKVSFAVKATDGASRAAQVATIYVLAQLGGFTADEFKALSKYTQPSVTNWKGDVVGQLRIAKPS